jgi:hypothetical protein
VPDKVIDELRATIGADQVHVIEDTIQPGQTVQIAGGPLHGLQAGSPGIGSVPHFSSHRLLLFWLTREMRD